MEKPGSKLSVYIHGRERKIGPFCDSYESAVILCQRLFPALVHATEVGFYAMDLVIGGAKDYPMEICAEVWEDVASTCAHITKMVVVDQSSKLLEVVKVSTRKAIDIKTMTGKTVSVKGSFSVGSVKERIQQLDGTPAHLQQLICNGVEKADDINLSDLPLRWSTIQLRWKRSE